MRWQCVIGALLLLGCCAGHPTATQQPAPDWQPKVSTPQFAADTGPRVLVDAAHGNFHTIDGRFAAFARLLRADGYRVSSAAQPITPALLAEADVFVIANAVKGGENATWVLPTPFAFEHDEVAALAQWVHEGGSLLLIADHMPFPGSAANVADAFGIVFLDGYAKKSFDASGTLIFTRAGGLAEHPITRGRGAAEEIAAIKAVYFPYEHSEITRTTPTESARGLLQGAVLRHGQGRVAVFGEAAMFSAQTVVLGDQVIGRMGMNDPEASQNAQFVLNVLHWLSGLLPD